MVAWLTIAKLKEQIRQTEQLAADQRQRRARAARAMLPLALSELAEYATTCIRKLRDLRPCFLSNGSLDRTKSHELLASWTVPQFGYKVLSILKECIEFVDDEPGEAIAILIRHLQVHNTRLQEDLSTLRLSNGRHSLSFAIIEQDIIDAAEIYARASALIPFSRGSTVYSFSPFRGEVYNALLFARSFNSVQEMDLLADRWQQTQIP